MGERAARHATSVMPRDRSATLDAEWDRSTCARGAAEEAHMVSKPVRRGLVLGFILVGAAAAEALPGEPQNQETLTKARLEILRRSFDRIEQSLTFPSPEESKLPSAWAPLKIELLVRWSRRWMDAERDLNRSKSGRIVAIEALREGGFTAGNDLAVDTLPFERPEAEAWPAQAKAGP
jgi:hypothetical protein